MRRSHLLLGVAVITIAAVTASLALAGPRWVFLGERIVTDGLDHDRIIVTAARGNFTAVKLAVKKHAVDFHRMIIHFGDGSDQNVELRYTIPAGGESRVIDVTGGDRVISSLEFWYDAHTLGGKRGVVRAFGRR